MALPEQRLRADYDAQMAATLVPGATTAVAQLVGCVYCLLDGDGQPLYVGKSTGVRERLGARLGRHVLGQRSDAAGRAFPPYEVLSVDVYPMRVPSTNAAALTAVEHALVKHAEARLYLSLAGGSHPPLNEKAPAMPPGAAPIVLPPPINVRFTTDPVLVAELWNPDVRVERWIDVIKVMANRIRTSGGTLDQRRVLRLQTKRLVSLL